MDAEDLKIKIKTKAHENHLEPQDIMQMYFFERLLYRIGISKYKYNFILKGGLYYLQYLVMNVGPPKIWIQC